MLLCLSLRETKVFTPRVNKGSYIIHSHLPAAVEGSPLDVAPDALLLEEGYLDATGPSKYEDVLLQIYDAFETTELVEAQ